MTSSRFYLNFSKIFVIASWINLIPALIAYFLNVPQIIVASIILALVCAALAIIFFILFKKESDREDLEIIKEMDKYIRNGNDKNEK